ncbi:hypothetical protein QR680_007258 [Steinernema hermaphroditum]|uniref:ADF-H domain-containing protein n=1 Tax=Steinernema hermaphroditum TaxID=289476 RepID=A0AA39LYJ3_9BILA|nr:hypothetical protein QR680_007258 [Steinernema hermaphroditum]
MSSGVLIHPDCQTTFRKLSDGKREIRYIIYKIQDKEVGTSGDDYESSSKAAYEEFVKDLKQRTDGFTDCRYAVFDFKFTCTRPGAGTSKMDKIVFIQLCPDGASIKKKMVYASSASAIKSSLDASRFIQFQVSDESEIAHSELISKLNDKFHD